MGELAKDVVVDNPIVSHLPCAAASLMPTETPVEAPSFRSAAAN